jgi:transcriptional regulator with XRE-family HTH domain
MDEATIVATFSQKLKELRLASNMTLEELSGKSGVSISTISKIENQQQKPSFETVLRMARALKVNFVEMLEPSLPAARNLARRAITRAPDAPVYPSAHYTYATHAAEITHKAMVPLIMKIKTREVPPPEEWSIHAGEEFIYVVDGILEFHTEQYAPAILYKGDSCYLDSTMRHAFVSKSANDALIVSVCLSIIPFAETAVDR